MGYYYYEIAGDAGAISGMSWLAITSLVFYIIAFSLGWGPIPMLVTSEIFPVKVCGVFCMQTLLNI